MSMSFPESQLSSLDTDPNIESKVCNSVSNCMTLYLRVLKYSITRFDLGSYAAHIAKYHSLSS